MKKKNFIKDVEYLRIPYEDIQEATKNFTSLIGRGGYGPVYKGKLSLDGKLTIVAVKRLQTRYGQGIKEFLTEIQMLSRYKHENLVSLVGFCEEYNEKFLVYMFAKHGSLDSYLKPKSSTCPLTWWRRINVCIDVARGLDHLHNHVEQNQRVIHRDIKSANILLDRNWKAMIADFGLSKIGRANENETYLITNAVGTHGYCDPAYIQTGILTKESDIYSFGVVMVEVLCGRLGFINVDSEERFLATLAKRYYREGKLNLIIDGDLKNHMNSGSMKVFLEVAFQCLQDDREQRPTMDLVLKNLEEALKLLNGELRVDYEVLEAIHDMGDTPLLFTMGDKKFFSRLSKGILVDKGKVWLSIDDDGKTQELISSIKVVPVDRDYKQLYAPESRFSKIVEVFRPQHGLSSMKVKIRTQFLSSNVIYAVYLVWKPNSFDATENCTQYELVYTLNDTSKYFSSYASKMEDREWWMFELFQTVSFKRTDDFEITFCNLYDSKGIPSNFLFEGIQFLPVQKSEDYLQSEDHDDVDDSEVDNLSTSNIEWENRLPSDYKQFIYYSNKRMMKQPQKDVIFPTEDAAYSILSRGVLIKLDHTTNIWFWITKFNGKKCLMLPPKSLYFYKNRVKLKKTTLNESRIGSALHLFPSKVIGVHFKVPRIFLSESTTYGCYLVYKMPQSRSSANLIRAVLMKLDYDNGLVGRQFTYLSIPQTPVIGPDGLCRSSNPMNKLKTIQLPRKRKDGWLEVNLGNKSDIDLWMNMKQDEQIYPRKTTQRSCFLPCTSSNEPGIMLDNCEDNVSNNKFTLYPRYFPNIIMDMWLPARLQRKIMPELIVQGIEFRPL